MNPYLQKMIDKKKAEGKGMSPSHQKAKETVLGDLSQHLSGMGLERLNAAKKAQMPKGTPAPSPEFAGAIDKAEHNPLSAREDAQTSDHGTNMEGSPAEEYAETPDYEAHEQASGHETGEPSHEELKAENHRLKMHIAKHGMKKF